MVMKHKWVQKKTIMDESGVEPETFRMLSERATNYATRPVSGGKRSAHPHTSARKKYEKKLIQ